MPIRWVLVAEVYTLVVCSVLLPMRANSVLWCAFNEVLYATAQQAFVIHF
jgi:hypothetical protein